MPQGFHHASPLMARWPATLPCAVLAALLLARFASAAALDATVPVGGVARHYLLVVPKSYSGSPLPLVFAFHGKNNTGALMVSDTGLPEIMDRLGYIGAFPDGIEKEWNGGQMDPTSLQSARSDDVDFVSAMIDQVSLRYKVDPKRVYATGSSNGAVFCYTLAARLSDRIAAIAPVNGLLGARPAARYHPGPVSVISFNGTDDPMMPYGGYRYVHDGALSVPDTISYWVKADGCDPVAEITRYPVSANDDGTTILSAHFRPGPSGSEVTAFIIGHGGHTWPGRHTDPGWAKVAGKTAMSISASDLMFEFFRRHPKP